MENIHEFYRREFENSLKEAMASAPPKKLLLHVCCAPCSSYVLEYIGKYFNTTLYYYNPNIFPKEEFTKRLAELERFNEEAGHRGVIVSPEYRSEEFFEEVKGFEKLGEGSERCRKCYRLRLRKTAEYAVRNGFDIFTTTLSISPYKKSEWLNEIGCELEKEYGVKYLCADFKKKNGYKRSIELSKEYSLYRQNYCGCIFSRQEAEEREK